MSNYEIVQRRRNYIVGAFVILAILCLVWLVYKFGDLPIQVSKIRSFKIMVQFPTARGIQTDTPVRFCGYQIGRVTKIIAPTPLPNLKTRQVYHQTTVVMHIEKKYSKIPEFWRATEKAFRYVTKYGQEPLTLPCGIKFWRDGSTTFIGLLSGRYIRYPNARATISGNLGFKYGNLWGGILTENIVQATARDILAYAILNTKHYNIVLHRHDSLTYLIPKNGAEAM